MNRILMRCELLRGSDMNRILMRCEFLRGSDLSRIPTSTVFKEAKVSAEFSDQSGFQKECIVEKPYCCAFSEKGTISEASGREA